MNNVIHQYADAIKALNLPAEWQVDIQIRPRRRSLGLSLHPGYRIVMAVPPTERPERAAAFVAAKRAIIARKLAEVAGASEAVMNAATGKKLVDGETFDLLGMTYRLKLVDYGPAAMADPATYELRLRRDSPAAQQRAVRNWYITEGLAWARHVGAAVEARGGITGLSYAVRDIGRTRWGLYSPKKHQADFAWRLFQLSPDLVEYVIVHELVHATRPAGTPHGPQFQRLMDRWLPGHRALRKRLNDAGLGMWRGEFHATDQA